MVTGTVIRPVRGAGLVSALLPLHMPFKDAPALIRANPRSLGVPARFAPQFAADTRAITTASFRRMLRANQRFRIPSGLAAAGVPLLLAGEREARAVKASLRDLAAAVPGADCRLVAAPATPGRSPTRTSSPRRCGHSPKAARCPHACMPQDRGPAERRTRRQDTVPRPPEPIRGGEHRDTGIMIRYSKPTTSHNRT